MPEAPSRLVGDIKFGGKLEAGWMNPRFAEKITAQLSRAVSQETGVRPEDIVNALGQAGRLVQDFIYTARTLSNMPNANGVRRWCSGLGDLSKDEKALAGAWFLGAALDRESVIVDPKSGISRFTRAAEWQAILRDINLGFLNLGKRRVGASNTGPRNGLYLLAETIAQGPSDRSPIMEERIVTRKEEVLIGGHRVMANKDYRITGGDPGKDEEWKLQGRRVAQTVVDTTVVGNILHEQEDLGSRAENLAASMRRWFEQQKQ